jgi:hypothetical protein
MLVLRKTRMLLVYEKNNISQDKYGILIVRKVPLKVTFIWLDTYQIVHTYINKTWTSD